MLYACLTSDLVESRKLPDRSEVQTRLEAALLEVNRACSDELLVPLAITLGDEWQGLFRTTRAALDADFRIRWRLYPLAIASGVGVGGLDTPVRDRTALMDGPCFHRSREALEEAQVRKGSATVHRSSPGLGVLDETVDTVCLLLHSLAERWTGRQFEVLRAYAAHDTEAAAARALKISQPTLHQSLDRSRGKTYLEARDSLLRIVETLRPGDETP